MTLLLNPRFLIALACVLAFSHFTAYRTGRAAVRAKWDAAKAETERATQAQATRMRELQRAAELRYVVKREAQDRFIAVTVKEIHEAAAPLATCPVPERAVGLLNAARECAIGDPASACGAGGQLPAPR